MFPEAVPQALAKMAWLRPHFVTDDGLLAMSIHALLVETAGLRLVVDTCVGNDKIRSLPNLHMLSTGFLESLGSIGWGRDSVDGVLCTHLHVDHAGWNTMLVDGRWTPTFPNARYYFGRKEYEFWMSDVSGQAGHDGIPADVSHVLDGAALFNDSVKPVVDAGLVTLVEMDAGIAPGVRLMPTPGHTPGHVSVCLESKGERAIITGDTFHHPCQIGRPGWASLFDHSPAGASETRLVLLRQLADSEVLVIGTHFVSPTAGRVVRDGDDFSFRV
ncbi:MAG: MBL fold metallo-hydrolase [Steroidobacteraceae bacterium]